MYLLLILFLWLNPEQYNLYKISFRVTTFLPVLWNNLFKIRMFYYVKVGRTYLENFHGLANFVSDEINIQIRK